ncbi:zinc finger protein [Nonomuraea sp. NPDC023979]|uniref:zinc finger protein n=1 Tax=Nonomuraea sp. NPDC023979 TaxID=3154796 RepID=UPI00340417ED
MKPQRQPQPPARPMWTCDECGTRNEAWRRICRNCQTAAGIDQCDPERIAAVAAIVAAAPPLTAEQIVKIRRIFGGTTSRQLAA